jgi:hypothetical protein
MERSQSDTAMTTWSKRMSNGAASSSPCPMHLTLGRDATQGMRPFVFLTLRWNAQ